MKDLKLVVSKFSEAKKEISLVRNSITLHQNKLEALENHSSRNNKSKRYTESEEREASESIESKVKDVISDKLGIDGDIERAHRVEGKTRQQHGNQVSEPERPPGSRTIVCRLRNWKRQEEILRKARREKPDGLFISEDLSPETLAKRVYQLCSSSEGS